MKKSLLLYFIAIPILLKSQSGEWTWVNGYNTFNGAGVFGTQGVADANNKPPSLWSVFYWTDSDGNFWLFGGLRNGSEYAALWKYDPTLNIWTWMKGPSLASQPGVYGIKGIPSVGNYPGSRAWGSCSWIDSEDNLWLFGGQGRDADGEYGQLDDVWKYSIATNEWTWMAGSDDIYPLFSYGTFQTPSPSNTPGGRVSTRACWIDGADNLWLFGGEGILVGSQFSDVWKFDPSINQWSWMKGPTTTNEAKVAGPVGIYNNSYTPGGRSAFSSWVDQTGKFWFFGGIRAYSDYYADMWAFDPGLLQWAFMGGSALTSDNGMEGNKCESSTGFYPGCRYQNTACWVDQYGRFWQYGGFNLSGTSQDLWCFDPVSLEWTWTSGFVSGLGFGSYGTLGVADPSNIPYGSGGSAAWRDNAGNLWLYGGFTYIGANGLGDLWKFTPDPNCPQPLLLPLEIIQFDLALIESNLVLLQWSTASEVDNYTYSIERSNNGINFQVIKTLSASANSNMVQQYSYIDPHPSDGVNYYRIRTTGLNNNTFYSPVKSILVELPNCIIVTFSNPATNPIAINIHCNEERCDEFSLLIYDLYGRKMLDQLISGDQVLPLPYLLPGIYFVSVRQVGGFRTMELVVN